MIPQLTTLSKLDDCLAFMKMPDNYSNNTDFAALKLHEMSINTPCISPTFRPSFYNLTIIANGSGNCMVGNESFELRSGNVFISRPDSFLSSNWNFIGKVYHICFSKDFVSEHLPEGINSIMNTDKMNGCTKTLSKETMLYLEQTFIEIFDENNSFLPYKEEMLANLTLCLLFTIQQQDKEKPYSKIEKNTAIVNAFHQNLDDNFNNLLTGKNSIVMRTKEHANLLNLNENHLCKVISNSTNKTINDWINEKMIDEINYLLKHSDKSIKEIAALFAFTDVNHFYTYFKSQTLHAPGAIRKEFLNNKLTPKKL